MVSDADFDSKNPRELGIKNENYYFSRFNYPRTYIIDLKLIAYFVNKLFSNQWKLIFLKAGDARRFQPQGKVSLMDDELRILLSKL